MTVVGNMEVDTMKANQNGVLKKEQQNISMTKVRGHES